MEITLWLSLQLAAGVLVLVVLFVLHRMRNFGRSNNAEKSGDSKLRSASMGVTASYATAPHPWLQGSRWDTAVLFDYLKSDGIRQLSTDFYTRVYDDEDAPWFRDMFKRRASLQQSIDRQVDFFIQMWGGPKVYTASNKQHCLRYIVSDHAGAKMFAKHDLSRERAPGITDEGAVRWLFHMNNAINNQKPAWVTAFGKDDAWMIEKTMRWFFDHVLERMVWGGPTKSWTVQRTVFHILKAMTKQFMN
jgi:truncated hemoglobin YjbI